MKPTIQCSHCQEPLEPSRWNTDDFTSCDTCQKPQKVLVFPAAMQEPMPALPSPLRAEDDLAASCFFHPAMQSEAVCDHCGRFACSLCHLHAGRESYCPQCAITGRAEGSIKSLISERIDYGRVALSLALWPILTFWGTVIGAPAALYVIFRYRKTPDCPVRGAGAWKFALAGLFAVVELLFLSVILIAFFTKGFNTR